MRQDGWSGALHKRLECPNPRPAPWLSILYSQLQNPLSQRTGATNYHTHSTTSSQARCPEFKRRYNLTLPCPRTRLTFGPLFLMALFRVATVNLDKLTSVFANRPQRASSHKHWISLHGWGARLGQAADFAIAQPSLG
jgi:hypothetical protein